MLAPLPLEAIGPPDADCVEIEPATRTPAPRPSFTFGTFPDFLAPDLYSDFDVPGMRCYWLRDTRVTFDAILVHRGQPLWSLALNHPADHVGRALAAHVPDLAALPVRRIAGRAAIIHGPGFHVFGHWLVDFLPRLYVMRRAGLNIDELKIILPRNVARFAQEFLWLIGIQPENIVWHDHKTELLQPDELIVPTVLRLANRFGTSFKAATYFWLERFCRKAGLVEEPCAGRNLYISRGMHPSNRQFRFREEIENLAMQAGYDLVYPERLALPQQVRLFRSATRVIGEYGSGLHSTMFSPPGAAICALRGTSHHPGFAQSGLAERFGQSCGYVFGLTPEFAEDQDVAIDKGAFGRALEAMAFLGVG